MSALHQKTLFDAFAELTPSDTPQSPETADHPSAGVDRPVLSEEARNVADYFKDDGVSTVVFTGLVRLTDLIVFLALGLSMQLIVLPPDTPWSWGLAGLAIAGACLGVAMMQSVSGYLIDNMRTIVAQIGRVIAAWTLAIAAVASAIYFLAELGDIQRAWFGGLLVSGMLYLAVSRTVVSRIVRSWADKGYLERRTVIIGGGSAAAELIKDLEAEPNNNIRICGVFDDRSDDRSPPVIAGYPKLGNINALVEFGRLAKIDTLIVAIPITAESRMLEMLKTLWVLPVDIRLSAHTNKLKFRPRSYSYIGSVPTLAVANRPIADWDHALKSAFDRVCAAGLIVALSPVLLGAALAVKLTSKGPIIFKQQRHGFNNQLIGIYKFRSMFTDMSDASAAKLVTKNDPRVTPVGRFLRKTSIDELPQLFNVLKGELSLVGPRPHALEAKAANKLYSDVVDGYFARHRVRPGITGWAQINGWRGETDTKDKIQKRTEHDLYYIENWSLWFDLYILLLTPFRIINSENAY